MKPLDILRKLIEQQQYDVLRDSCEKFWHDSHHPAILGVWSFACTVLGEKEQALEYLAQARSHQKELDDDALTDLVAALIVLEDIDAAIEILESILASNPSHSLATARRGYCHLQKNELAKAEQYFERSAQLEPTKIAVLDHLASILITRMDYDRAEEVVRQGLYQLAQQRNDMPDDLVEGYFQSLTDMQLQVSINKGQ